jgi:hypothetical protein
MMILGSMTDLLSVVTTAPKTAAYPGAVTVSHLRQELDAWEGRLNTQPSMIRRFLEAQAASLAEALSQGALPNQLRFNLPDRIFTGAAGQPVSVPADLREQVVGGLVERLTGSDISATLRQQLAELEQSPSRAAAVAAGLLRHAVARHMVHNLLPSGRTVNNVAIEGEEIPTLPEGDPPGLDSAITVAGDAIAEEFAPEAGRGDLQVPYVPAARRFYLPQLVAFDDHGALLVKTVKEAESLINAIQRFLSVLHGAVSLAPYYVADDDYQRKRYGMLGQLINQGRALACHETGEIVRAIRQRAAKRDLNRGLSLSLPYFDDQLLLIRTLDFEVIPAARIVFLPAFVVRAAREEAAKVGQDTRLSPSTRKHLLNSLRALEAAFDSSPVRER